MASALGPNAVEDGLILALDAGNTKSYPGSGDTWIDLSGQGNNATRVNPSEIGFNTNRSFDYTSGPIMYGD